MGRTAASGGEVLAEAHRAPGVSHGSWRRLLACGAIFVFLAMWPFILPYTGDGDAIGHYLNLRQSHHDPAAGLYAWARPLFVLLMIGPAAGGILVARLAMAALSTLVAWLTMRMADRLEMPNAALAGVMVVLQPLAFALAADTMTEMPLALGVVIAIHLWWSGRHVTGTLLVGFLPLVRPEGIAIAGLWAVMLVCRRGGGWVARLGVLPLLLAGTAAWMGACWVIVGDPLMFLRHWSWPAQSYDAYGHGGPLDYVWRWPLYGGPVLTVLLVAGARKSLTYRGGDGPSMRLPWAVWLLVLGLHGFLWWRGLFASVGFMRVLACTAPITALICLCGWNRMFGRQRRAGIAALCLAVAWAVGQFLLTAPNLRCLPIRRTADYIRAHDLASGRRFFTADEIVLGELDRDVSWPLLARNQWGREEQLALLASLPPGSRGVWDTERGLDWYQIDIAEVEALGYERLHTETQTVIRFRRTERLFRAGWHVQKYALLRRN